ncbi:MAG: Rieske (2Fe-2S) protein [Chitinophagaceae bacterium]
MERKECIKTFGFGMAGVCVAGCLASCSKDGSSAPPPPPGGGGPPPRPTGVNFTVDLASEIKNPGESVTKNGVIVVRLTAGATATSFTAVQVACTHQGTSINFDTGQNNFLCPNHGSRFSNAGAVLNGPASTNLKNYKVDITGNTMTVTG